MNGGTNKRGYQISLGSLQCARRDSADLTDRRRTTTTRTRTRRTRPRTGRRRRKRRRRRY
jgi:hypothetical protein